ncbi:MAG: lectin-like protein [Hyalangium sp.]|uniref:lectin-like protein n=1 Tax=Hyalangium sp. TaxID=2028555 RepID=UPI00389B2B05
MRNVRTLSAVSRPMLLGLAALLFGGCGVATDEANTGSVSDLQVQQAALLPDQCAPVPANHTTYGGLLYHLYSSGKTWADAKADCTAMGGRLATPANSGANAAITSIITDLTYIGINQASGQSSTSAGWQTPEGYAASYFNWNSGEPNDMDGVEDGWQNCARMYTTGYWDDVYCGNSSPYVCEFGTPPLQCAGGSTCALGNDSNYHCFCPPGQHFDAQHNVCANGP